MRAKSGAPATRTGADLAGDAAPSYRSVDHLGLAIGTGRTLVGLAFLAKPVESVRFLGVDSGTAQRLDWLARMTAARDAALGVGTVVSSIRGRGSSAWLLAGAACDLVDAVVIGAAASGKRLAPLPGVAVGIVAIAGSVAATATVLAPRREHRNG
jgi:hypothetical protein